MSSWSASLPQLSIICKLDFLTNLFRVLHLGTITFYVCSHLLIFFFSFCTCESEGTDFTSGESQTGKKQTLLLCSPPPCSSASAAGSVWPSMLQSLHRPPVLLHFAKLHRDSVMWCNVLEGPTSFLRVIYSWFWN